MYKQTKTLRFVCSLVVSLLSNLIKDDILRANNGL